MGDPTVNDDGSLLLTLEETSQLVAHSHNPAETLTNIVRLIQGRFHTAVCSVYFYEPARSELVLGATVGLDPAAIGRVRMRLEEGLTGLVGERMLPVMEADAPRHPRFKYFPEAGEDPYRSFLGVPLVEGGSLVGVLVLQTIEPRLYSAGEVRMLVTVAAQLAALVEDARLLEHVAIMAHQPARIITEQPATAVVLHGEPLSPGSGLGSAYVVDGFEEWRRDVPMKGQNPTQEKRRLALALKHARDEISHLSQRISELVGEDHGAILQAQLMIMQDHTIEQDLNACLAAGASAEGALFATLDKYVAAFQKVSTPFFQERVYDIKDVFHRLLWQLRPRPRAEEGDDRVVLVAHEASVMELFAVDLDRLAGVVVEHGGAQSHAAILARSLNIPMVGHISDFAPLLQAGRRLLVDGTAGTVTLDPHPCCVVPVRAGEPASVEAPATLEAGLPRVEVNVNLLYEARSAAALGVEGVGLYRSEFLFLARRTLPTEEEQVNIYRKLLQLLPDRPVTIRTFDLRPDKLASYAQLGHAVSHPFDWRLVLSSPPLQQLFQDQVRALLRASTQGSLRILVPLMTSTELLDFVLETLERARSSLRQEGLDYARDIPLGVMIEVAAAVPLVQTWSKQVSFFAIGTNDLTASALGLDRDDPVIARQADALHPGMLRLIDEVVCTAHKEGKMVSVCGEVAADPVGALALASLGVDSLSVPVNRFTATRQALAPVSPRNLPQLRSELLEQRTTGAVRDVLSGKRLAPS